MQVEHVAGVRLAARRAAQQQRHGAVRLSLLGEVVEDDQHMLALVHPVLPDGRAGVGRDVLVASRVRRRCRDDRGVLERAGLLQGSANGSDGRALLTNRDVNAAHLLLRVTAVPGALLVHDRVDSDSRLPGLAVADDQLPLATTDRDHRVNGLDPGLQWLIDALPIHHAGGLQLERHDAHQWA